VQKNSWFFNYLVFLLTTFFALMIGEAFSSNGGLPQQSSSTIAIMVAIGGALLISEFIRVGSENAKSEREAILTEMQNHLELLSKTLTVLTDNMGKIDEEINDITDSYSLRRSLILKQTKNTKLQKNLRKLERSVAELRVFKIRPYESSDQEKFQLKAASLFTAIEEIAKEVNNFEDELIELGGEIQVKRLEDLERDHTSRLRDKHRGNNIDKNDEEDDERGDESNTQNPGLTPRKR
jgi:hypothetical protein